MDDELSAALDENNSQLAPRISELVEKYRSILKQTGTKIVDQAKTIYEAEETFGRRDQIAFYQAVGLDPDSSTVRKLKTVGKYATRFEPHLDKLPQTWTTLYELAKLPADEFRKVVDSGCLSPHVTAQQIRDVVRGKKPPRPRTRRAAIDLSAAKDGRGLYQKLRAIAGEHGVELIVDTQTMKEYEPANPEVPE